MKRASSTFAVIAVFSLFGSILAACGDESQAVDTAAPEPPQTAPEPPNEPPEPLLVPDTSVEIVSGSQAFGWVSPASLTGNPFAEPVGEWVGGDAVRIYPLPDGRQLWMMNDSFVPRDGMAPVNQFKFIRNIAFIRDLDGSLTMLAGGEPGTRTEFIPHADRDRFRRFYWPLGGEVDGDMLKIFLAEMRCDRPQWGICFYPISTQLATFTWADMALVSIEPAPNPGVRPVYGFSVASDEEWSYLFGNGHEFNTPDEWGGSNQVFVARVPRGKLEQPPHYWDGSGWNPDPATAVPLVQRGYADFRMAVIRWGDRWIGLAKEDEFVGQRIIVMEADRPEGPWRDLEWIPLGEPPGIPAGVTYDAIPYPEPVDGRLAIFYSTNSQLEPVVFEDPSVYRPVLLVTDLR